MDDPETPMTRKPSDSEPFSGLAFKVMADQFLGTLTFVRVYRCCNTCHADVGCVKMLHCSGDIQRSCSRQSHLCLARFRTGGRCTRWNHPFLRSAAQLEQHIQL